MKLRPTVLMLFFSVCCWYSAISQTGQSRFYSNDGKLFADTAYSIPKNNLKKFITIEDTLINRLKINYKLNEPLIYFQGNCVEFDLILSFAISSDGIVILFPEKHNQQDSLCLNGINRKDLLSEFKAMYKNIKHKTLQEFPPDLNIDEKYYLPFHIEVIYDPPIDSIFQIIPFEIENNTIFLRTVHFRNEPKNHQPMLMGINDGAECDFHTFCADSFFMAKNYYQARIGYSRFVWTENTRNKIIFQRLIECDEHLTIEQLKELLKQGVPFAKYSLCKKYLQLNDIENAYKCATYYNTTDNIEERRSITHQYLLSIETYDSPTIIKILVFDSISGEKISYPNIQLNPVKISSKSNYKYHYFDSIPAGDYQLAVSYHGYVDKIQPLHVSGNGNDSVLHKIYLVKSSIEIPSPPSPLYDISIIDIYTNKNGKEINRKIKKGGELPYGIRPFIMKKHNHKKLLVESIEGKTSCTKQLDTLPLSPTHSCFYIEGVLWKEYKYNNKNLLIEYGASYHCSKDTCGGYRYFEKYEYDVNNKMKRKTIAHYGERQIDIEELYHYNKSDKIERLVIKNIHGNTITNLIVYVYTYNNKNELILKEGFEKGHLFYSKKYR